MVQMLGELKHDGMLYRFETDNPINSPIHRKSDIHANDKDGRPYMSRLEHCGSCQSEQEDGYEPIYSDYCCCVHSQIESKKQENEMVKQSGFWERVEL